MIEAFASKIVASWDGFDWYLRFDGGPDDPLYCKIEGKRKTTTKIVVAGQIPLPYIVAPQAAIKG